MSIDVERLPHQGIQTLVPYKPGKSIEELRNEKGLKDIIKLASNENPLGCSPKALDALHAMSSQITATYPSPLNHELMTKLADKLNIKSQQLMLSNGSDFIFSMLLYCFALNTNKHILTHDYAFSTYAIQAQTLGIPVHSVPVGCDFKVDVDLLIQACTPQTSLIFIANPNNPTGLLLSAAEVKHLLEHIPESTILVLDEAYYEFAAAAFALNSISWLEQYPNLVITRTFSKIYGLAGLRLGYALSNPSIISLLRRVQLPFVVNQAAMHCALAALDDEAFMQQSLKNNEEGMKFMQSGYDKLGLDYFPSACNFLTINCKEDSLKLFEFLLNQGIIIRPLHAYKMDEYARITIGTKEQNERLLDKLGQYYHH